MLRAFVYLTFLLIGVLSFSLYKAWHPSYPIFAVLQGPILMTLYTCLLFYVTNGSREFLSYLYFVLYFVMAVIILFGISFSCCGYGGFFVSILASAFCGLLFIKGIGLFLDSDFTASLYAGFFAGLLSHLLYLLLFVPAISELFPPWHSARNVGGNIFAPLFLLWISVVGAVITWRLRLR